MRHLARIGLRLPNFRLATPGGRSVALNDLLDRKLLLFLWASWDASRDELHRLEEFHREHGRRIRVVSVAFDVQGPALPLRYLREARATFDQLIDATCHLTRMWGVRRIPLVLCTDERGHILQLDDSPSPAFLKRAVELSNLPSEHDEAPARIEGPGIDLEARLQKCNNLLSRARTGDAINALRDALELDSQNDIIRRQIWALRNPEKFYEGPVDEEWLRKAQAATTRRRTAKA